MTPADVIALLEQQFGATIKAKKLDAGFDPSVVVDPADLVEVCRFLRDDPRLKFEVLANVSGVDYLEMDPKKVAKAGFEPHLEVVYHFQSFTHKHRFTLKVILPRWKGDQAGELPEVPSVAGLWRVADWHGRAAYDLCGVWSTGHPDLPRV